MRILLATVLLSGCFTFRAASSKDASTEPVEEKLPAKYVDGEPDTKLWACMRDDAPPDKDPRSGELTCFEFMGFLRYVAERNPMDAGVKEL